MLMRDSFIFSLDIERDSMGVRSVVVLVGKLTGYRFPSFRSWVSVFTFRF